MIGAGIGVGAGGQEHRLTPDQVLLGTAPVEYWDFADPATMTLDGTNILSIASKGSGGTALARNSGDYIDVDTGKSVCNGSQNDYRAGIAGQFDYLHDGSGSHVFVVHSKPADTNNFTGFLMSNTLGSSNDPGIRWGPNTISAAQGYQSIVGKSGSNLGHLTDAKTMTLGVPVIAEYTIETVAGTNDIVQREDGILLRADSDGGELTETSHGEPLRAMVSYAGDLYGVLIYNRRLTDAERYRVYAALRRKYGMNVTANLTIALGHSNVVGAGSAASLNANYQGFIHKSYIYAYENGNTGNALTFWQLEQDNCQFNSDTGAHGFELSMMYTLSNASGAKEFLLKSATNGSVQFVNWNPEDSGENATHWIQFLARLADCKIKLRQMGYKNINFRGCIIGLGENDASEPYPARSEQYEEIALRLNALLREVTNRPDLKIVLIKTSTQEPEDTSGRGDGLMSHQDTIRAAQDAIAAAEANTVTYQPLISGTLDWSEADPNGIHYNSASLQQMGIELAGLL